MWHSNTSGSNGFARVVFTQAPQPNANITLNEEGARRVLFGGERAQVGTMVLETGTGITICGFSIEAESRGSIRLVWPSNTVADEGLRIYLQSRVVEFIQDWFRKLDHVANHPVDNPWSVLGLSGPVAREEAESAYRKACRQAHPDLGGDHLEMVKVNHAWDVIKERMGWV